jgi:hypothetical protein
MSALSMWNGRNGGEIRRLLACKMLNLVRLKHCLGGAPLATLLQRPRIWGSFCRVLGWNRHTASTEMLPARFRMPNAGTFHGCVVERVSAYSAARTHCQTQPEALSNERKGEEWRLSDVSKKGAPAWPSSLADP